jgi:hypothetical protein
MGKNSWNGEKFERSLIIQKTFLFISEIDLSFFGIDIDLIRYGK